MDSSFLNKLSEEEVTKITPSIFDTLQKIIKEVDTENKDKNVLIDAYKHEGVTIKVGSTIGMGSIIYILQSLQILAGSGGIVVEMDGLCGHIYHVVKPENILNLLQVPLPQCTIRLNTSGDMIFIEPHARYNWEICMIILIKEVHEIFKDFIN